MKAENLHNAIIMGRKTWESIPIERRPLPGRLNVILSKNKDYVPAYPLTSKIEPKVFESLEQALYKLNDDPKVAEVFVIGG